jgi:hypothetical protein
MASVNTREGADLVKRLADMICDVRQCGKEQALVVAIAIEEKLFKQSDNQADYLRKAIMRSAMG